mmetsp:Transcript_36375/g.91400  ORF Transcript_36375/g.91400 Transcript_36375/m.91400 type:complete len:593 (-) Transcript_36375:82-1860(-)
MRGVPMVTRRGCATDHPEASERGPEERGGGGANRVCNAGGVGQRRHPSRHRSHAEHPRVGPSRRRVHGRAQAEPKHLPRVHGVDHAVIPEVGARVVAVPLLVILVDDLPLERLHFIFVPRFPVALALLQLHLRQHSSRLLAAHHADPGVWPHEHEVWAVGAAAHAVVAGTKAAPDDEGDLGHLGVGHRHHHLGAVLGDAARLVLLPHHEACDVLQEDEGDASLGAQLHKVRPLQSALGEHDAVVGHDAHGAPVQLAKARHKGGAIFLLKLMEPTAVQDARQHCADVPWGARVGGHNAAQVGRRVERLLPRGRRPRGAGQAAAAREPAVQVGHDAAGDVQRVGLISRHVVGDPGLAAVQLRAAQLLRIHDLARGGAHQRRAAQEDGAVALHNHGLVGHCGDVGAASCAGPHDNRHLWDAEGGHLRLVVEDAAKVVAVREHLRLAREVGAARINHIDARQMALLSNLLQPQVLLDGDGVVGAALDGGVVGHHRHHLPLHPADPRHHTTRGHRLLTIQTLARQLRQLQEGRPGVQQGVNPLARQHLPAGAVPRDRHLAAAGRGLGHRILELSHGVIHGGRVGGELWVERPCATVV